MSANGEFNPYAAPQTQAPAIGPHDFVMKRPASVKWMTAVMVIIVPTLAILYAQQFPQHGWSLWTDYPLGTVLDAAKGITCFALLFGGRRPWVYWIASFSLLASVIGGVQRAWRDWTTLIVIDPFGKAVETGFMMLFIYGVFRFVFGSPARTYFGLLPSKEVLSPKPKPPLDS